MSYSVQNIRNVCLLGHSGSGKTTLAENLLLMTGAIERMGRVADGNTVCDYDPEEVKRQISLSTAVAPIEYKGCRINVLDTPGAFDFSGEVMEALRAADAAIIVCSAKDGVSVGMEKAWKYCEERNMPRFIYISKTDEDNSDYNATFDALRERFGKNIAPVAAPIWDADKKVIGFIDVLHKRAFEAGPKGERIEIDLNNIMYDFAENFVEENRGIEYEDFRMELIREVAVEPQIDEATYKDAKPGELVEAIVKALKEAYARRAKAVADTVRPVMERIYEDRKDQLDSNIYFPLTDGHLGYNVPVNLLKCQSTDGAEIYKVFSKVVMFTTIDDAWREHLREMDDLRQSVQNATYEQKDPLLIYKFESFGLFSKMLVKVNREVLAILDKAYIPVREQSAEEVRRQQQERERMQIERERRAKVDVNKLQASRMQAAAQAGQQDRSKPMPVHVEKKVGRNDPCPCGSGKKYKNCHGKGL